MASEDTAFGSDSFLDVMANMVGILIVLVMIALMRAGEVKHANRADIEKIATDVKALNKEASNLEGEVRRLGGEIETVDRAAARAHAERDALALVAAAHERELNERRQKLDGKTREEYDLRRELASVSTDLEQVKFALDQKSKVKQATVTKINTYPTPISRTVNGRQLHFQLRHNRVSYVPMEEMVKLFEEDARRTVMRLRDVSEVEETLGPMNGFRMRYHLEREDVPVRVNGGQGTASRISYGFVLIPISETMGETIEQALAPNSEMRDTLHDYDPNKITVTLWTYPDSFGAFRAMKQELYLLGYSVAGRPLPEGQPIGASSDGTKSSAE
jgi:outer membrane murein-binding lipoprotein Lpp